MYTIFISYSHKDDKWIDLITAHLSVLGVEIWHDRKIEFGASWSAEIEAALNRAKIAVCLVSADYLFSEYIASVEVPALLERRTSERLVVIPVLVRDVDWKAVPWLGKIQMIPRDGKSIASHFKGRKESVLRELTERVRSIISELDAKSDKVRGSPRRPKAFPEEYENIQRLRPTGRRLFGRTAELALLDRSWTEGSVNILSFVAWGGVGKTTLVTQWLARMRRAGYRDAKRVFAWSFHDDSTNDVIALAELFIREAFAWFKGPNDRNYTDLDAWSSWAKGEGLAALVQQHKTLLILDGLEALQSFYPYDYGKVRNTAIASLLAKLAVENPGLCVITTRVPVASQFSTDPSGTVLETNLERITSDAGLRMLEADGVIGTKAQLKRLAKEFHCHALSLKLVASYVRESGDRSVTHATEIQPVDSATEPEKQVGRVLAAFAKHFGDGPVIQLLRVLGLIRRAASYDEIEKLRAEKISDLTDHLHRLSVEEVMALVYQLRQAGFISQFSLRGRVYEDTHPLIREYFDEELRRVNVESWRKGHLVLYDHYSVAVKGFPRSDDDTLALCLAVIHGCEAGEQQHAFEQILWERVLQGYTYFLQYKAGIGDIFPNLLRLFFSVPWERAVSGVDPAWWGKILTCAGLALRGAGRYPEALRASDAALRVSIDREDWLDAAFSAGYYSRLHANMGNVCLAVGLARDCVLYADRRDAPDLSKAARNVLATALHQFGRLAEAEVLFRESLSIAREGPFNLALILDVQYYQFLDLLLDLDREEEVIAAAEPAMREMDIQHSGPLIVALFDLVLGRALLMSDQRSGSRPSPQAEKYIGRAVEVLRDTWILDYAPRGLLARAEIRCLNGSLGAAKSDLEEALNITRRVGMEVHEADCHLGLAQLLLAKGDTAAAKKSLDVARNLVLKTGYYRRNSLLRSLETAVEALGPS
jgi:tetratricopeptide (TPR) repeat protein